MGERDTPTTDPDRGDDASERDDTEGYVHRPSGEPPRKPETVDDEFGWRGWLLVGVVVVCFLVIPWALIFLPSAQGLVADLGLSIRDTYLVVPLVPAFVLGALGVWTALHARRE